jgi:hypothetical protein
MGSGGVVSQRHESVFLVLQALSGTPHKLTKPSSRWPSNFPGFLAKSGMPGELPELLQVLPDNDS